MADPHVNTLHAGGAGVGAHKPVVNTAHVVVMHTGEEADGLSHVEVHHAYGASAEGGREGGWLM